MATMLTLDTAEKARLSFSAWLKKDHPTLAQAVIDADSPKPSPSVGPVDNDTEAEMWCYPLEFNTCLYDFECLDIRWSEEANKTVVILTSDIRVGLYFFEGDEGEWDEE